MYGKLHAAHDPEYYTRQMTQEIAKTGASYYADAVLEQGEPQGTWVGEGLADLGIHDGDKVDRAAFPVALRRVQGIRRPARTSAARRG